jgi:steroid delta-isomerase-like uncharacterized protein
LVFGRAGQVARGEANYCKLAYCTFLSLGVGFPNPCCSRRYSDTGLVVPEEVSLMSVSPKEVVRRLYQEAWNERKFEVIDQLISQSHALVAPNVSGAATGPAAYKRQIESFVAGFPDLRFVVEEIISENDRVVAAWAWSGTHRGEFLGIAPTNKKVSVAGITIHQIANGKILDSHAAWDSLGLVRQLGVELPRKLEKRAVSTS